MSGSDGPIVVGLGELLWDVFPARERLGGAPANFACGVGRRARTWLVSAVGDDDRGRRAVEILEQHGVNPALVERSAHPTGTVTVTVDPAGEPDYAIDTPAAWDDIRWTTGLGALAARTDAVCFGTLAQRAQPARTAIRNFVAATPADALRLLDVNLRPPFDDAATVITSLELANVVKLNHEELAVLAPHLGVTGTPVEQLHQLAQRFELRAGALTRGAGGAVLVRGDEVSEHAGVATTVVNTVGAGDAFAAELALGLLASRDLSSLNADACRLAARVCAQDGATILECTSGN